jgi:UDP-glucuronate decarboxylase
VATARSILLGAANLSELAVTRQARLLLASTSEVYGDPELHPQPEAYWGHVNPVGTRSCYSESKRAAEALCFAYHRERGLSLKVARIFNTYGPRMGRSDGRVVSSFILSALQGVPLSVHGDGRQTRSFCYVDDLVDGLVRLMSSPQTLVGPVNLGMPEEISMIALAERILSLTGARTPIVFSPRPEDDPHRRCPDIRLAREALSWEPRTPLDDGLRQTISYYECLLGASCGSAPTWDTP